MPRVVAEIDIVVDRDRTVLLAERDRDVRKHVERTLRTRTFHARDRIQHGEHAIALAGKLDRLLRRKVLRARQRRNRGRGDDFRQIGDVIGVQRNHGLRHFLRRGDETNAPAWHAVGLRQRVDDDRALAQLRLDVQEVVIAHAIENEAVVDVVADDPSVRILGDDFRQHGDLVLRIDHAGRVRRVVE